jgi:hypothetical protein
MEFGIFSDEGLVEDSFFSLEDAQARLAEVYAEDDAHVGELCHDHPEHEADTCELCNGEGEDENEDGIA